MKLPAIIVLVLLTSCNKNSSPEGRMSIKLDQIQRQVDSLKEQNAIILDSISKMSEEVRKMHKSKERIVLQKK